MTFRRKLASAVTAGVLALSGGAGIVAATAAPALAATCTTSNVNGNCGPYQDPTVFRTSNATDLVTQNDFSAIPQTLTAQDSTSWTVAASTAGQQDQTSVKSYPATQVTYTTTAGKPEPVSTFGSSLTSTYTNLEPAGTGQDYEYAVDDWLADPTKNSWTNDFELMIWTDTHGQRPAGNDTGKVYTDASGTQWEVWTNAGSTTVSNNVDIVSFVRKVNSVSGSLDRIGFYNYMVAQGYLNTANFGIDQTNYGLEICSTGGATRTYGVSNYSLVVNGGGQQQAPVVSTGNASGVTDTAANLNGTVNPEGAATTYQFDYGTTTAYGSSIPVPAASAGSGSSPLNESAALSGLQPSTTYHYRIEATNSAGTTLGSDQTFTTAASGGQAAPVVNTNPASAVTDTSARLNGDVNPEGQSTAFQYDYGTTTAYGTSTGSGSAGSGSSSVSEPADITGLQPSTTYHFRIEATNATGTTFGNDQTFTTAATGGGGGGAMVAFDSQAGGKKTGTAPLSLTLNVGSGSNRALLIEDTVGVSASANNNQGDVGCTQSLMINGVPVPVTQKLGVVHTNNRHSGFMAVWGVPAPASGANTIKMSVSGCSSTPTLTMVAESFTGVDQANPFGALATAFGSGATASGTVSTPSASDMVGAFAAAGNSLQAPGAPAQHSLLENMNSNTGAGNSAGATAPATGSPVTVSWPVANDWWATGLVDLHHA